MNSVNWVGAAAAIVLAGCASVQSADRSTTPSTTQSGARATDASFSPEEFQKHHAEIREHLGHVDALAQRLASEPPAKQQETMRFVASFFADHILTHAAEEEATLYPRADAAAGARFTQSMRYEHTVVGAWVRELREISEQQAPDVPAFVRRTQRLLGLLEAHFGAEEEVVVPALAGR